jgi:hypothetical protein
MNEQSTPAVVASAPPTTAPLQRIEVLILFVVAAMMRLADRPCPLLRITPQGRLA